MTVNEVAVSSVVVIVRESAMSCSRAPETKTLLPLVPSIVRLSAKESKATNCPSPLMEGALLRLFPPSVSKVMLLFIWSKMKISWVAPFGSRSTRSVAVELNAINWPSALIEGSKPVLLLNRRVTFVSRS